jgi:hypothetical protein
MHDLPPPNGDDTFEPYATCSQLSRNFLRTAKVGRPELAEDIWASIGIKTLLHPLGAYAAQCL